MIPYLLIHTDLLKRKSQAEIMLLEQNLSISHPDLLWFDEESKLGIEQARQIQQFLSLKPYQGDKHAVIILAAENLTQDAQNALLKTLEEPAGEALIILGVSSEDQLLSTIISRCQNIDLRNKDGENTEDKINKYQKDIEKLITLDIEQRFQFIEKLREKEEFLLALTLFFRKQLLKVDIPPLGWEFNFLKDLIEAQRWTNQNVNIRAVLEYLMLKMPKG